MPAQTVDRACSLAHQILTVVDKQTQLALLSVETSLRQVWLAKRCPRDRERVDRIRLAIRAATITRVRHQLGRHPHDPLAGREQVALKTTREMPAVLDRPEALPAVCTSPTEKLEVIAGTGTNGPPGQLAAMLVADHRCMRALVRVDPDHHHRKRLLPLRGRTRDRSVGIAQSRSCQAPLKPRRPVPTVCAGRTRG